MTAHRSPIGLVALAVGLIAGCGTFLDGPAMNRCGSDTDCRTGTCDLELGMCVSEPRTTLRVGLEVVSGTDPYGATTVPVTFPAFDVTGPVTDARGKLELPLQVPTFGIVRDVGTGGPVTAELRFVAASAIEGGPAAQITAVAGTETTRDGRDGFESNFATQLPPGQRFDVTVQPTGRWLSELPPLRATLDSIAGDGSARVPIEYPQGCSASVLLDPSGAGPQDCLVAIEGSVVDPGGVAQAGMLVRVVDSSTGRVLSSTYTTGSDPEAEPGYFRVRLHFSRWIDPSTFFFRIVPSGARVEAEGPSATFTVDPAGLYEIDGRVTLLTPNPTAVVRYEGWVEGAGVGSLPGATLSFVSTEVEDGDTGVLGSYSTTTASLDDGRFEVQLVPGRYDVVITPLEPELAVERIEGLDLRTDGSGQLFEVPRRASFGGFVRTPNGTGMLNAQVRARARGVDLAGSLPGVALYARNAETYTDGRGGFGLPLDVGAFDVVVEPPAGSNYPWLVVPNQQIGSAGSEVAFTREWSIENPVPISGTASFRTGPDTLVPVVMGEIRAYAILETETGTRTIQIGRTTTDAEGHYTLLLPPSLSIP